MLFKNRSLKKTLRLEIKKSSKLWRFLWRRAPHHVYVYAILKKSYFLYFVFCIFRFFRIVTCCLLLYVWPKWRSHIIQLFDMFIIYCFHYKQSPRNYHTTLVMLCVNSDTLIINVSIRVMYLGGGGI